MDDWTVVGFFEDELQMIKDALDTEYLHSKDAEDKESRQAIIVRVENKINEALNGKEDE